MKKILIVLSVILLMCSSCSTKKTGEASEEKKDNQSVTIDIDGGNTSSNKEDSMFNDENTREIKAFNDNSSGRYWVYCRAPIMDLRFTDHNSEGGRDDSDNPTGKKIVAFTCSSLKANENDMFDVFSKYMLDDVSSYCKSETIENVSFKEVKVNGISAKKFIGSMRETREDHSNKDMDLYVTGYIFLDEDCVAGVWGLVFDKNQDPEAIKFVNEATEYMMSTVYFK